MATSGCVIMARTDAALKDLNRQVFRNCTCATRPPWCSASARCAKTKRVFSSKLTNTIDYDRVGRTPPPSCSVPGCTGPLFADVILADAILVRACPFASLVLFLCCRRALPLRSYYRAEKFREREVRKRYVAMVHGVLSADEGEIDLPLCRNRGCPPLHMVNFEHGKPSLTLW